MKRIIDISEHNGTINFSKVKESEIEGIIIRIGWIGNKRNHTLDKYFEEYYRLAKENGFKIGFYVYSYCESVATLRQGVEWLLEKIENKSFELPIFLDLEDEQISKLDKENLTEQAVQFCKIIEGSGYKSGVYASKYWFLNKLDINQLLNYKIWLAEWTENENNSLGYKVDLWQYTSEGEVNGIKTNVDINKCLCECLNVDIKENGDDEEMKIGFYVNGSTREDVYSDTALTNKIGSLNPYESCECLGIFNNRAIVRYKVDNKDNFKIGFVKWLGGVK